MYTFTFVYNFFTIVFGRLIFLFILTPQHSQVCVCVCDLYTFRSCVYVMHVCKVCLCICVCAVFEGEWNL